MNRNGLAPELAITLVERRAPQWIRKSDTDADRWRTQYVTDLIRDDVLDFSRVHVHRTLQPMFDLLCERISKVSWSTISCKTLGDKQNFSLSADC